VSTERSRSSDSSREDSLVTRQIESVVRARAAGQPTRAVEEKTESADEETRVREPVAVLGEPRAQVGADDFLKSRLLSGGGARVGRFVVQRHLDEGGMGLIFSAQDEELDRAVALKILRSQQSEGSTGRARLVREAQALAKLSHPNVVTVYEVGEWEGHVYVAMELIEGRTLRGWLRVKEWGWRDVVDKLTEAGRGLSAAHKAGIIHRDFKPSNVLVGHDGRVRVLDFGLAFAPGRSPADAPMMTAGVTESSSVNTGASTSNLLGEALTVVGSIAGTPAYMAPEQFEGREVDARADQYAFCLSLYEGLYRERPYTSKTVKGRREELATTPEPRLPRKPKIPAHVRRVLRRGLSLDPERRYESMEELLRSLGDDPTRRRRWLVGGAVMGALLLGGGYELARQETAMNDPCRGLGGDLEEIWSREQEAVGAAIIGTGQSYASATWERLQPSLAGYASAWKDQRTQACNAHKSGAHDAALYGMAVGCLKQRKVAFRALLEGLMDADARSLARALQAADALPSVERCSDVEVLTRTVPEPEDPAIAEELEGLGETLASARVDLLLRRHAAGLALSSAVVGRAVELGYRPLEADALAVYGQLQLLSGDYELAKATLTTALWRADVLRDDERLAQTMSSLIGCIAEQLGDYERATEMRLHAEAVLERLGENTSGAARLLTSLGNLETRKGNAGEAVELIERGLAILEELYGPEDRRVINVLVSLGVAYAGKGELARAESLNKRVLRIQEETLGSEHPALALTLNNLGALRGMQNDNDASLAYLERALRIKEAALGPDHPETAGLLGNLGASLSTSGRYAEALPYLERTLEIEEKARGPDHLFVANAVLNLGVAAQGLADLEAAQSYFERSLSIHAEKLGPDAPRAIQSLMYLGAVKAKRGDREGGLRDLYRAHELGLGKPEGGASDLLPELLFLLAEVLRESTSAKEEAQGIEYAKRSLAGYKEYGEDDDNEKVATLERWLAK